MTTWTYWSTGLISDTGTAVGWPAGLQFAPVLLFGLWGGVLADRHDRRTLLLWALSFVTELVGGSLITDAAGLNLLSPNAARLIGPAIAGVLITLIGTAGCSRSTPCPAHPSSAAQACRAPAHFLVNGSTPTGGTPHD
ncbi:hypothetical protein [Streptomyces sp. NPDC048565]|uniref:hypothetical protein n=1 Tax=Streptomyces sp. NPDC048565 TaxID=3155266 RepID=UPI0034394B1A